MDIQYYSDGLNNGFLYASEGAISKTNGQADELLGSGYGASRENSWSGCNLNGVSILNNRTDIPQVLNPETYDAMVDLPNWNASLDRADYEVLTDAEFAEIDIWGINSRTEVIRPYKNYLFAMDNYDDEGNHYPLMVRWSSPASAGDVPPSWDSFDPAERAGLYSLSDTPGRILDGKTLGDYFIIYKSDSVWTAQFIGGEFTFQFRKLFGAEAGMLSKDCVAEFEGKHFVVTPDGAYIHNGATMQEVMEKWVKDELFNNVDEARRLETKVVADHPNKEIWIYYTTPASTTTWADKALLWNWDTKEWSERDLTGISYIAEGRVQTEINDLPSWDETLGSWDSQITYWDDGVVPLNATPFRLLLSDYVNQAFYANEASVTQLGVPLYGTVERVGIDFNDDEVFKYLSRVTPHLRNTEDSTAGIEVFIKVEDFMSEDTAWESIGTFTPGTDHSLDCSYVGRYIGIKFGGEELWDLTGYTLEWEPAGTF
jgi:hypothetical protein